MPKIFNPPRNDAVPVSEEKAILSASPSLSLSLMHKIINHNFLKNIYVSRVRRGASISGNRLPIPIKRQSLRRYRRSISNRLGVTRTRLGDERNYTRAQPPPSAARNPIYVIGSPGARRWQSRGCIGMKVRGFARGAVRSQNATASMGEV